MAREKPLEELFDEYDSRIGRLKEINDRMQRRIEKRHDLEEEIRGVIDSYDPATDMWENAIARMESLGLKDRDQALTQESARLREESKEAQDALDDIQTRVGSGIERAFVAAAETGKMTFELGKLIATLNVAVAVAIAAIAPSIFPNLRSLEGLLPALGVLTASLVASIVLCVYSIVTVSDVLANVRKKKRSRLPEWASRVLAALPIATILSLSLSGLITGVLLFVLFVSANIG